MSSKDGPGQRDLCTMLATLSSTLHETIYVFVTHSSGFSTISHDLLAHAQMVFQEGEGVTLVLPQNIAEDHRLAYAFPSHMITVNVQSSLSAVGFLAAITNALKAVNMPVNPVSAFHHDYLFVPEGRGREAIDTLDALARESSR